MLVLIVLLACRGALEPIDSDLDGFTIATGDCLEGDAAVFPGAAELWYDGVDQDCDGNDADQDGDGFVPDAYAQAHPDWRTRLFGHADLDLGDCWDEPDEAPPGALSGAGLLGADIFPGALEAWYDGVDQDCDGASDFDQDGDGFDSAWDADAEGLVGEDCADGSANDPLPLDTCTGETLTAAAPAEVYPGADETWYDGVDQDCDGEDDFDQDGDGFRVCEECGDTDPSVKPNDAPEVWGDCLDQNCDGNDGDEDRDGYLPEGYDLACPDWATLNPGRDLGDCYDSAAAPLPGGGPLNGLAAPAPAEVYPGASDLPYDGVDGACDGDLGEFDADADGYDSAAQLGYDGAPAGGDCDDDDPDVSPGALESCGGGDEDCDGAVDEPDAEGCDPYYRDDDGDGYGVGASACLCAAEAPLTASATGDCDDADATLSPGATEVCDALNRDEDCDGYVDNDDPGATPRSTYYPDVDGDSYGDKAAGGKSLCEAEGVYTTANRTDCDDARADVSPAGAEVCDADDADEDCDTVADDADGSASGKVRHHKDNDGDGYGDRADGGQLRCDPNSTYLVTNKEDCDDTDANISPAEAEECDGGDEDEDCDGLADDDDDDVDLSAGLTYHPDRDGDGYGASDDGRLLCDPNDTYATTDSRDCDDTRASSNPAATEECDALNLDEDCDGLADDDDSTARAAGKTRAYPDADGDGYGDDSSAGILRCDPDEDGYALDDSDCDDGDADVSPAASERCDALNTDEDCDGSADDADTSASAATKTTHYADDDLDGYGDPSATSARCDTSASWPTTTAGDCDDDDATIAGLLRRRPRPRLRRRRRRGKQRRRRLLLRRRAGAQRADDRPLRARRPQRGVA
ncbi:putative metal-binding motif-containing protein [Myxococcota bacterium]|nr:putative metal-binding motif-containing protein [Myxococcota bacterium]